MVKQSGGFDLSRRKGCSCTRDRTFGEEGERGAGQVERLQVLVDEADRDVFG